METYQVPNGKSYRNWQAVFDDAQPLPWTAFNTGYIYGALKTYAQPDSVPPHRNPADRIEYAVIAFHFKHPTHGDILIDTGFDRTFHNNPPYGNLSFTMRVYATLMNVQYTQRPSDIDLMSHLKKHQIAPAHVFLTHLHADHTGGLPALPSQTSIYYAKQERTFLSRLLCGNHFAGKSSIHLLDMQLLLDKFNPALAEKKFVPLIVGVVILAILMAIPYVGWIFSLLAVLAGLGAIWMWSGELWRARKAAG